jgi:hypothetical protein
MQYITEFLNLRERLSHSYIIPKILMSLNPKPEIIDYIFENPKSWYQVILRTRLLYDIGENVFKLDCPDVFGKIKNQMEDIILDIENIRKIPDKSQEDCQQIINHANTFSDLVHRMAEFQYVVKHDELKAFIDSEKIQFEGIRETCRSMEEKIDEALLLAGGWEKEFLDLGIEYWNLRVSLESTLIRQMLLLDQIRVIPGDLFWETLYVIIDSDWIAEEALAAGTPQSNRKKTVEKLLIEKNMNSIEQYFTTMETKLLIFLEGYTNEKDTYH